MQTSRQGRLRIGSGVGITICSYVVIKSESGVPGRGANVL